MKPHNEFTIYREIIIANSDPRRLFLAYLHCLYEADRQDLLVKPPIAQPIILTKYGIVHIAFNLYKLSVHDLNVIFFFVLDLGINFFSSELTFNFDTCSVDDHGIETAVATLTHRAHTYHHFSKPCNICLAMPDNDFTHRGVGAIVSVCYLFNELLLAGNLHSPSSNVFIALKLLTEALSSGSAPSLNTLSLLSWKLTSRHAYHLLLLITQCRNLENIKIGYNQLRESVPLLVSAAKNLRVLDISASGIGDTELLQVGLILQSNTNLKMLYIYSRSDDDKEPISFETVSRFIQRIVALSSQSHLKYLFIHDCHMEHLRYDMNVQNGVNTFF